MSDDEDGRAAIVSLFTLFAQAQRGLLEPKLVDIKDPNNPTVSCQILLTPSFDGQGQQAMTVHAVKSFLDEYRVAPEAVEGTARLHDLNSFIAHVNRFKESGSSLFMDAGTNSNSPTLIAVFDYSPNREQPRWGTHVAKYVFPLSDEWIAWMEANGRLMSQAKFADFVEDRLMDVIDPSTDGPNGGPGELGALLAQATGIVYATPLKLLELSRGLMLRVEHTVGEVRNLATGEAQLMFTEQHTDAQGQPLRMPTGLVIGIPVFKNGDRHRIPARLRYRKDGTKLVFWYELYRASSVFDFAIRDACEVARAATSLPLYMGTPED
ncbi:MAG: DUF2303 family protein [Patescibacteria group bacterium]